MAIDAESIVTALTQDTGEAIYCLCDEMITGKLNLNHRIVKVAVDIQNCRFWEIVDLRYCEFTQAVNFSGCTFYQTFNSGDEIESYTVYRKDLICDKVIFKGGASFNGVKCEGNAHFRKTQFENEEQVIDFVGASLRALFCNGAVFKGGASFNSAKCEGRGYFPETRFENEKQLIDFSYASFGELVCSGAVFKGGASFNSVKCEGNGFFRGMQFENEEQIEFRYASFGELVCSGAVFKGGASFNSVKCEGSGHFRGTQFKNKGQEIDFGYASFGKNLEFRESIFFGGVDLSSAQISNEVILKDTTFQKKVEFQNATMIRPFQLG